MATAIQATYKVLLYSLIHQIHSINVPKSSCNIPSILPTCANEICTQKVCAIDPACCTSSWDIHCTKIACDTNTINGITEYGICQSIGTSCMDPSCHIPHDSGGCQSLKCTNKICEISAECCTIKWTDSCARLACDINNGICNNIIDACIFDNNLLLDAENEKHYNNKNRKLLQTVCGNLNIPCPGNQYRNPTTCRCECDNSQSNICPGNQIFSGVLCECGCSTAPTCNSPKQFNMILCECECPIQTCLPTQQFDDIICECINKEIICNTFDPCLGLQQRNPNTCNCECDNIFECLGNQQFNQVSCDCQCPITPTCITPKSFNPITCKCECDHDIICNNNQMLNTNMCICENKNIDTLPCPMGIQIRNPISNECECENTSVCPGNQEFNILCQCQCPTTPICNILQQFNPINCQCECINSKICQLPQILDINTCECITPQIQTSNPICSNMKCPHNQILNTETCNCQCDYEIVSCPGNQQYNVFCDCTCPITPICKTPKQFNVISCQCECAQVTICNNINQIFNTDTCMCDTIPTDNPTIIPTIIPTITPTSIPTIPPSKIPTISPTIYPTKYPTIIPSITPSISPTNIPSNNPSNIPTNMPTNNPSNNPSHNPSFLPTNIPTNNPSNIPTNMPTFTTNIPTITPSNNPSKIPTNIPSIIPTNIPSNNPSNIPTNIPSIAPIIPTTILTTIPTISPTKTYPYIKIFILELNADYNYLIQDLNIENILIETWAIEAIKQIIHFNAPIISNNIRIKIRNISNILSNIIIIQYTIETYIIEVMHIIIDLLDSKEVVYMFGKRYDIITNEILETEDPTPNPTPEPINNEYYIHKRLIFTLSGDYNILMDHLQQTNININTWGMNAVESLIHYNDPIIESNTKIIINNIISGSIIIECTLDIKRIEIFDIITNNIYNTDMIIVGNNMFNVMSNKIITTTTTTNIPTQITECVNIGQQCNNILKCCENGVICMSENTNINGICCIDYNNYGCLKDNDCCYDNSYCDINKGICFRKNVQRVQTDGMYNPSDSKEDDNEIIHINNGEHEYDIAILNGYNDDDKVNNYESIEKEYIISPIIKILLVILIIFVICFNGMCFIYNKWEKNLKTKCVKSEKHINVNII